MSDLIRKMCVFEELEHARNLIVSGFAELQEIRMGNDLFATTIDSKWS